MRSTQTRGGASIARSVLEVTEGLSVELRQQLKLNEVDSPFTRFNFGNIAGRLSELLGDLPLSHLVFNSRLSELPPKATIGRAVKGIFRHACFFGNKQAYNGNRTAPKIGAYIRWREWRIAQKKCNASKRTETL